MAYSNTKVPQLLKKAGEGGGGEQVRGRISQGVGSSGAGHSRSHPFPCSFEGPGAGGGLVYVTVYVTDSLSSLLSVVRSICSPLLLLVVVVSYNLFYYMYSVCHELTLLSVVCHKLSLLFYLARPLSLFTLLPGTLCNSHLFRLSQ